MSIFSIFYIVQRINIIYLKQADNSKQTISHHNFYLSFFLIKFFRRMCFNCQNYSHWTTCNKMFLRNTSTYCLLHYLPASAIWILFLKLIIQFSVCYSWKQKTTCINYYALKMKLKLEFIDIFCWTCIVVSFRLLVFEDTYIGLNRYYYYYLMWKIFQFNVNISFK